MLKSVFFLLLLRLPFVSGRVQRFDKPLPTPATQVLKGCAPNDSCQRIGSSDNPSNMSPEEFEKAHCLCDPDCWKYKDCCPDAASIEKTLKADTQWKCGLLPGSTDAEHIYMIGHCPSDWIDKHDVELCERRVFDYSYLLDLPVFSKSTKRAYSNIYCAKCNQDVELASLDLRLKCPANVTNCLDMVRGATYHPGWHKWTVPRNGGHEAKTIELEVATFQDWNLLKLMFHPRRCHPAVDECLENKSQDSKNKCAKSADYVYTSHSRMTYKNIHCALCNDVNPSQLTCSVAKIDSYPKKFYISSLPGATVPFSVILDLGDPMGSDLVGKQRRCTYGSIFDFINDECVPFSCGKQSAKVNGECVIIETNNTNNYKNCHMLKVKKTDVTILDSKIIYVNKTGMKYEMGYYEEHDNHSYLICDIWDSYIDKFSTIQSSLSVVCMTISLTCLALHISIHVSIAKLRNLPGKNLLSLAIALFFAQALFVFGVNSAVIYPGLCVTIAVFTHFCFLVSFFWMNVMAFDIYRTFTSPHQRSYIDNQNKTFCRYAIYAWFIPAIIVLSAITVEYTNILPGIRPNYGSHICWISHRPGLLVFFAVPLSLLLLANAVFFVLTAYGILRTTRVAHHLTQKTSYRIRFYIYIKLAVVMGLTWILGFVAAAVDDSEALWYVFIVFNASQGAVIFVAFTLKRKVLRLVCERIGGRAPKILVGISMISKPSSRRTSSTKTTSLKDFTEPPKENSVKDTS